LGSALAINEINDLELIFRLAHKLIHKKCAELAAPAGMGSLRRVSGVVIFFA
jgi:hypothetical protein